MSWLREPIVVTRRLAIAAGLMLGLLAAGGILSVADRFDRFADQRRTEAEVAAIAKRVFRIETPTDRELQRRIMRALEICARDPDCLRSLDRTVRQATAVAGEPTTRSPASSPAPSDSDLGPIGQVPAPGPPGGGPGGGGPSPRPPGQPDPPAPEPPAPPPRIVDLEIPPIGPVRIPPVCGPLVSVNCRP